MLRCKVQRSMRGRTEGGLSSGHKALWPFVLSARSERVLLLPLLAGGGWEGVAFDFATESDPSPAHPCKRGRERRQLRVGWGERQRSPTLWVRGGKVCTPTYVCSR